MSYCKMPKMFISDFETAFNLIALGRANPHRVLAFFECNRVKWLSFEILICAIFFLICSSNVHINCGLCILYSVMSPFDGWLVGCLGFMAL